MKLEAESNNLQEAPNLDKEKSNEDLNSESKNKNIE